MQKKIFYLFLLLTSVGCGFAIAKTKATNETVELKEKKSTIELSETSQLYQEMELENKISYDAFEQIMKGYNKVNTKKKDIITLIDFTKPSTQERLFIFDLKSKKIILSSLVAHGKKSGENYATSFSNNTNSHQSSLGFYLTDETYNSKKNGYSLLLNGLEKGINDKARERAVVIHAANYANPSVIKSGGRLGRSYGCPALPEAINEKVIDLIKGGTLLYIYANNKEYMNQTSLLQ